MSKAYDPSEVDLLQLSKEQKLQILKGARELLGPNGENWTKACWWGVKCSEDEMRERLAAAGFGADLSAEEMQEIDNNNDHEFSRFAIDEGEADKANVWCLVGALEETAYRLGIVEYREDSERLTFPISLRDLVRSNQEWQNWNVVDVNDRTTTTWETVRELLDTRIAQIEAS